jgi:hypothetical protein
VDEHRKYMREYMREARRKRRLEALIHYGGNPPTCACCGEKALEFMTIDHINGGGSRHRRELGIAARIGGESKGSGADTFWWWLKRNNYPSGFRVLCMNCNFSLGHRGYCPHRPEEKSLNSLRALGRMG